MGIDISITFIVILPVNIILAIHVNVHPHTTMYIILYSRTFIRYNELCEQTN